MGRMKNRKGKKDYLSGTKAVFGRKAIYAGKIVFISNFPVFHNGTWWIDYISGCVEGSAPMQEIAMPEGLNDDYIPLLDCNSSSISERIYAKTIKAMLVDKEDKKIIYGIDFDGTIVEEDFPNIGKPIERTVKFIKELQLRGHKWILITMREGDLLELAVGWLKAQGLTPNAINDNLPERKEKWGNNPRKVYADVYIDDHNAGGMRLPEF